MREAWLAEDSLYVKSQEALLMHLTLMQLDYLQPAWRDCRLIRQAVFIEEQGVPVELEWDEADRKARHVLARVDGLPAGCARVLPDGHIGRMAVLRERRGQGIGMALLLQAVQICRALEVTHARLSAQTHAIAFYQQAGFEICSEPYSDANILHVDMQLELV